MRLPLIASLSLCLGLAATLAAEDLDTYRWSLSGDEAARAALDDKAILFSCASPNGQLSLRPEGREQSWDLSAREFLLVDLENRSETRQLRLNVRLRSEGKEYVCGVALNPHEKRTLSMRLPHRALMEMPPGVPAPAGLDTSRISNIDFYLQWPYERETLGLIDCRISNLRTKGTVDQQQSPGNTSGFFPFIDAFGQYAHKSWPEKITAPAQLVAARAAEAAELASSRRPASWNEFGGWQDGPALNATGSFRTEKYQGKWYLVDPKGRLFFSHGLDVLKLQSDALRTSGRRAWFAGTPSMPQWQPITANLALKYGSEDFAAACYETMSRRLEHWGFNTIGNWADSELMKLGRTPYTLQLTDFNDKWPHLGKQKFYDVFDPAFATQMRQIFEEPRHREMFTRSLTDPYCIGYFINNELSFRNPVKLVNEILRAPASQAAKAEFGRWLKTRYGTIDRLNQAWGVSLADWEALPKSDLVGEKDLLGDREAYKTDAREFSLIMFDRYFSICHDAVKSVAPNRLYLGCRFIGTDGGNQALAAICAKYCDVLSVNVYSHTPANFPLEGFPDIPVMIGEFHFGIGDRGMFNPGLCIAGTTTADRGLAYTRFLQGALTHPNIVGAHWFQYRDQPLIGRWDGEGYQIGFVDVADTPYLEMTAAARTIGENMYAYRLAGKLVEMPAAAKP